MVDISQKRAKNIKNDEILSLDKSLASFFYKKTYLSPPYGSHYSAYWASSNTDSNTYAYNAKGFPPNWLMNYFESNWYSTIKIARYYLLRIICELCERVSKQLIYLLNPTKLQKLEEQARN